MTIKGGSRYGLITCRLYDREKYIATARLPRVLESVDWLPQGEFRRAQAALVVQAIIERPLRAFRFFRVPHARLFDLEIYRGNFIVPSGAEHTKGRGGGLS